MATIKFALIICIVMLLLTQYYFYSQNKQNKTDISQLYEYIFSLSDNRTLTRQIDGNEPIVEFGSACDCRARNKVFLKETPDNYMVLASYGDNSLNKMNKYNVSKNIFESSIISCDLYNWFRRGPHQRVISYALYGNNRFYYKYVKSLIHRISEFYPGWIVRIHYDNTIDHSFKCEIECMKKENSEEYYDNVDFCNIDELPYNLTATWNASYMHGMTWRWLPIGDSFIDFVNSRDTDAWIHQRELDSVNVWLNSNTLFHVMRDAPVHGIAIVGGYWGFANVRNRELATKLHNILTNKEIAYRYNHVKNRKGDDQSLLTAHFAQYQRNNSTTHDSFTCQQYGGDPWPTQRPDSDGGYCFVGCTAQYHPGCCDQEVEEPKKKYPHICPPACRPKNHQDWIHC